jgi:hypothetical protein
MENLEPLGGKFALPSEDQQQGGNFGSGGVGGGDGGGFTDTFNEMYSAKSINFSNILDNIIKGDSFETRVKHKYIKREGGPGNYTYTYAEPTGGHDGGDSNETAKPKDDLLSSIEDMSKEDLEKAKTILEKMKENPKFKETAEQNLTKINEKLGATKTDDMLTRQQFEDEIGIPESSLSPEKREIRNKRIALQNKIGVINNDFHLKKKVSEKEIIQYGVPKEGDPKWKIDKYNKRKAELEKIQEERNKNVLEYLTLWGMSSLYTEIIKDLDEKDKPIKYVVKDKLK